MSGGAVIIIIDPQVQQKVSADADRTGAPPPQPYDAIRKAIDEAEVAGQRVRIIVTG